MASCMGLIGSFIVLSALLMGATEGAFYNVGDSVGWRLPPSENYYSDWASTKTFFVGDSLLFNWTGTHSVGDVSKADYDSCNTRASAFGSNSNKTVFQVTLLHGGPRYFICTVGDHCLRGMKFSINVESGEAADPAASPPGSSAPTLSSGVLPAVLSTAVAYLFTRI